MLAAGSTLIEPAIERPRANFALAQIGLARNPNGSACSKTHSAGTAATAAVGRIMETRNSASPGLRVSAVNTKPAATIPAMRPCAISPSQSRTAGEAQINKTTINRTFYTLRPDRDAAATLAWDLSCRQALRTCSMAPRAERERCTPVSTQWPRQAERYADKNHRIVFDK
jgi:hypothetical protein